MTEIHDYLRLLFARVGTPYCPDHPDKPLAAQTVSQMVDTVLAMPEGKRLMILAPVLSARKGEHQDLFDDLQSQGYIRVRVRSDGKGAKAKIVELTDDAPLELSRTHKHSVDVVVDRIKVNPDAKQRLAESFETAIRLGDGRAIVLDMDGEDEHLFSSKFACPIVIIRCQN